MIRPGPRNLPNNWAIDGITGMFVDKDDHIWVLNRPRDFDKKEDAAAVTARRRMLLPPPAVMEFDSAGNLLTAWGKPEMVPGWPKSEHTIFTDNAGNVYIGGAQAGDTLLKFTGDGKFISDFGHRGPAGEAPQKQDNQQTDLLLRGVAAATLDEDAHEIYIADGYLNRRVMVYDWDTGNFKRGWGAYGKPLSEINNDPQPPHDPKGRAGRGIQIPGPLRAHFQDGLVYVCDRAGNRIQVFTKQGKFLKEFFIANGTLRGGPQVRSTSRPIRSRNTSSSPTSRTMWSGSWIARPARSWTRSAITAMTAASSTSSMWPPWILRATSIPAKWNSGKRIQKFVPVRSVRSPNGSIGAGAAGCIAQ